MVKYFLSFLFVFLMLSSFSYARNIEAQLKSEYGQDLKRAPFFLQFRFSKEHYKNWANSKYEERKFFLMDYDNNLAQEKAEEKADARAEAAKKRERLLKKEALQRKDEVRTKAELAEEAAQIKADSDREKAFKKTIADQGRELQQMQVDYAQTNK